MMIPALSPVSGKRATSVPTPRRNKPAVSATGIALLILGASLVVMSLLADRLDIGGGAGFGYQQLIALIIGIVLVLGGLRVIAQPWFSRIGGSDLATFDG